jgi:hypothetical protein
MKPGTPLAMFAAAKSKANRHGDSPVVAARRANR